MIQMKDSEIQGKFSNPLASVGTYIFLMVNPLMVKSYSVSRDDAVT
jgi:hypothetical protein